MKTKNKTSDPRTDTSPSASAETGFGSHDRRILVLQGGGALGAYQAGVYEGRSSEVSRPTGSPASRSARSTPR